MTEPLGYRSNNPGNLRPLSKGEWFGQDGTVTTAGGGTYCKFKTMELGVRAAARNILTYYRKHRLDTVRKIIERWAPPEDKNHTRAYVEAVAKALGVHPEATINPTAHDVLPRLMAPIFRQENGRRPDGADWISDDQVRAGCELALRG